MSYQSYTFRLFKEKRSLIDGAASLFSFGNSEGRYNFDKTEKEADSKSLCADWLAIGEDMKDAIEYVTSKAGK